MASAFRTAEKRFKARAQQPDLSRVVDPAHAVQIPGLVVLPAFLDHAQQRHLIRWALADHARHPNDTNLDTHYRIPPEGIWHAHLHSLSHPDVTQPILPKATQDTAAPAPNAGPRQLINNVPASVDTLSVINATPKPPAPPSPTAQPMLPSALLYKLRWANIGWYYHWGIKQYDFSKGKGHIDPYMRDICRDAVEAVNWDQVFSGTESEWPDGKAEWKDWRETYEPDAGIVNFYQEKDTLMAHVDRSEVCATSPLVSISLGNSAIFLIGGPTRDTEPTPILLRSGDVVIMSGPICRRAYHGVPRILEGTLPNHLCREALAGVERESWAAYEDYMRTTRININVRQGVLVDLYVPRKCAATNQLITAKDHASVQISIADVDANGRALPTTTTFAFCGQIRSQGEGDDSLNRLATKAGHILLMVEISRPHSPRFTEEDRYRLVYSKSKVYVNPTAYARDNIPGFVALVKREAQNPTYLLAWIPETLLNEKGSSEWDKFVKIEESPSQDSEDDDVVLIDLPIQRPESYAFSVPLTSIYSLIVQPPSLSSWYGSIGINLINGDTLPILHFHDDESHSFTLQSPTISRAHDPAAIKTSLNSGTTTYPPPPPPDQISHVPRPPNSWGGEDLLSRLRQYAHILRSTLQPTLFLVDPSKADRETHTTQIFDDDAVDDILAQSSFANSHSPVPAHRRPRPLSQAAGTNLHPLQNPSVLHRSLGSASSYNTSTPQTRMALLQSFSNITRATRHAAQNILSHPLAKPIVPHLPDPVRSLVSAPGEWEWGSWVEKGGVGEFESARVYLARWARIVAEEGERARRREAQALPSIDADNEQETSSLGIFELLHTTANLPTPKSSRSPESPVTEREWAAWFDAQGRPVVCVEEFKREIFRRGISGGKDLRKKVWPFLLGVFNWNSTAAERATFWREQRQQYQKIKSEWWEVPDVFDRQDVIEERHRIDVDCRRTDRNQPLFAIPPPTPDVDASAKSKNRRPHPTVSLQSDEYGAQSPSNEHIERLSNILLTYNFYEKELGYVQGMSDLCAPIYVVMDADEEMTFWCFVYFMERMKKNFLRDQSGMKQQLSTLQQLIEVMDPELFRHLDKTDGLNLFFCFRWVLIAFKREFPFDDVLRLWEVLWTDYYSTQFVLFVALAVLESHRDVILRYLVEFDEILKYCNELSMTIELDTTLAQAEVLFLSFAQLVADIDRRKAEEVGSTRTSYMRNRSTGTNDQTKHANLGMLKLSDELRELLVSGA
ncbi:hypothetical protein AGABI2DRAFT_183265 [Agaricus bisporus var. bisporus H97]|uniref:hypothetical protein n=1 Tax=Agaricus bisporus var. bisporus (strain H97 / ATCC MYA-4626 / FGSC 10389) TaxID=936046 RepID=UPI00029F7A5E|nr:hypothetical protein AGABI2DRAFT_183265 [Agaricus bisporus var. bisporus H97]EKV50132.1 hypothetical protein AGABI2DRAFT_183265 [Agaricus bisporus var. bisporus H97]